MKGTLDGIVKPRKRDEGRRLSLAGRIAHFVRTIRRGVEQQETLGRERALVTHGGRYFSLLRHGRRHTTASLHVVVYSVVVYVVVIVSERYRGRRRVGIEMRRCEKWTDGLGSVEGGRHFVEF